MPSIVVLSGPICSGKSQLSQKLKEEAGFEVYLTSKRIRELTGNADDQKRKSLQDLSRDLDSASNYAWIANDLKQLKEDRLIVVDSVRFVQQISKIRDQFGWRVVHVHLSAPLDELKRRFSIRAATKDSGVTFEEANSDETEANSDDLAKIADLQIDTSRSDESDVYVRVAARLGMFAPPNRKYVDVLIGSQFGSEGKGQVAAYLAREYDIVMRVGGPNAGHRVNSESGQFTYIHLPSGSRDHSASIFLGAGAVINASELLKEIKDTGIDPSRITIDENCVLVLEEDIEKEKKLAKSISSTGQGVGAATARKIWRGQEGKVILAKDEPALKDMVGSVVEKLEKAYSSERRIFLEGTQGSGLSLHHGAYPYVTSRDTNVAGCLAEAGVSPTRVKHVVMVVRPYPIRVGDPPDGGGTSGELKRLISWDIVAERAGLDAAKLNASEVTSRTKKLRKVGEFDWSLYRRACALNAPTDIAFTFADYITVRNRDAFRFEQLSKKTISFIEELERVAQAPVSLINTKFDQRSVIDRRNWGVGRGLWQKI